MNDWRAMHERGVSVDVRCYPGELRAFQAWVSRPHALAAWREKLSALDHELAVPLLAKG
jgi:hypothetical protein